MLERSSLGRSSRHLGPGVGACQYDQFEAVKSDISQDLKISRGEARNEDYLPRYPA